MTKELTIVEALEKLKEEDEGLESELETFDDQMDFLANDEQEAIDGYKKIIALVQDEHVKKQLEKIMLEEIAHKEYLEKVKTDPSIEYTEPLIDEETKEEDKILVPEEE